MRMRVLASAGALSILPLIGSAGPAFSTFGLLSLLSRIAGVGWTMPWQINPASDASRAQGEVTFVSYVPVYGSVRGTSTALRYLLTPLPEQPGRNTLVEACRMAIGRAAAKFGRVQIEASSAGPEQLTRDGIIAPVSFRLVYARLGGQEDYEIRQTTLMCAADRSGQIVDATAA